MFWWEFLIIGFLAGEIVGEIVMRYKSKQKQ